jgi:hypothetical protein
MRPGKVVAHQSGTSLAAAAALHGRGPAGLQEGKPPQGDALMKGGRNEQDHATPAAPSRRPQALTRRAPGGDTGDVNQKLLRSAPCRPWGVHKNRREMSTLPAIPASRPALDRGRGVTAPSEPDGLSAATVGDPLAQFRCAGCGYGASRSTAPERCPMCGQGIWEQQDCRPFLHLPPESA